MVQDRLMENFELIVCRREGGIEHWFRQNNINTFPWNSAGVFAMQLGEVEQLSLFQSQHDGVYEIAAIAGGKLFHFRASNSDAWAVQCGEALDISAL